MSFQTGISGNPSGKPRGAKNKKTLKTEIFEFLKANLRDVITKYKELPPEQQVRFYSALLNYCLPKMGRQPAIPEFEHMTLEQLMEYNERTKELNTSKWSTVKQISSKP